MAALQETMPKRDLVAGKSVGSGARRIVRRAAIIVIAGLFAAAAILWLNFQREMAELHARVVGRSQSVDTSFGALEYAVTGEGLPVLAIHGSGGGFDQALEMVGPLTAYGYRLIAPSRFGYLGSEFPANASPETQADALAELLDHLGEARVAVFGGSAGALSAMQFAIRYPERCSALVLMVPATFSPDRRPKTGPFEAPIAQFLVTRALRSDFLFWLAATFVPDALTRTILATEPRVVEAAGPEERKRVKAVLRHILPVSRRTQGLLLDMRTAGAPPRYDLERIACPVLAISAEDDLYGTATSAEYTAANVPGGRLVLYRTGGHLLVGRSQEVWQKIAAFLAEANEPE
jgi:pimeloyl-ACP methyl ester carboxylesterase